MDKPQRRANATSATEEDPLLPQHDPSSLKEPQRVTSTLEESVQEDRDKRTEESRTDENEKPEDSWSKENEEETSQREDIGTPRKRKCTPSTTRS
eukprot:Ihof_evm14s15 gene=Ihof_evmTU14s15